MRVVAVSFAFAVAFLVVIPAELALSEVEWGDLLLHFAVRSLYPNQRIVISTKAAHAFCEQRSGEICFSIEALRSNSFHCLYYPCNLFFTFSAQKSHVKSQNRLNHTNETRSSWHFSYTPNAILDI
jgi:hypothetical protein